MEQNLTTVQKINNKYKFIDKTPKYFHTNIENITNNKSPRKKEISYVMNLGKNSGYYLSPKIRRNNKYLESDLSYEDENINTYFKGEKSFLREMQYKIDEQKNEIRILKKVIYDKEKEINELNYELLLTQNELEDNLDSEEYYKLLRDYDININDYNKLKDEYNKLVDKYNILKEEKNKIYTDNKSLRRECNYIKEELNKTLDEYNNIVEDYNKLKINYNNIKNKENNTDESTINLIKDKNNDIIDGLQEENKKLKEDNKNLTNKFKTLTEEKEKIDNDYNNIILDEDAILQCLYNKARVKEVLKNGKRIPLGFDNYNVPNPMGFDLQEASTEDEGIRQYQIQNITLKAGTQGQKPQPEVVDYTIVDARANILKMRNEKNPPVKTIGTPVNSTQNVTAAYKSDIKKSDIIEVPSEETKSTTKEENKETTPFEPNKGSEEKTDKKPSITKLLATDLNKPPKKKLP